MDVNLRLFDSGVRIQLKNAICDVFKDLTTDESFITILIKYGTYIIIILNIKPPAACQIQRHIFKVFLVTQLVSKSTSSLFCSFLLATLLTASSCLPLLLLVRPIFAVDKFMRKVAYVCS